MSAQVEFFLAQLGRYVEGRSEGFSEGLAQGLTDAILRVIQKRFPGEWPPELIRQLKQVARSAREHGGSSTPELHCLLDVALDAASFDAFHRRLLSSVPAHRVAGKRKTSRSPNTSPAGSRVGRQATGKSAAQRREGLPRSRNE